MAESGPDEPGNMDVLSVPERTMAGFCRTVGGRIPAGARSAFSLLTPDLPAVPVLLSVPHAGRAYPPALLEQMRYPERTALMLEDRHVDLLGEAVARETGATLLIAEAPRAMLDLNRAPDDVDWSMIAGGGRASTANSLANRRSRSGLGLVPRKLARVGEIWTRPLDPGDLRQRLDTIHAPYHAALAGALAGLHDRWGAALLIDLHSMPPIAGQGTDKPGPHIVVGDRFGAACGRELSAFALAHLGRTRKVAHNLPYAGGYILDRHGAPGRNIHALQVEVCRSTYLDAEMREVGVRFAAIARELAGFVRAIAEEVTWMGRSSVAWAAE